MFFLACLFKSLYLRITFVEYFRHFIHHFKRWLKVKEWPNYQFWYTNYNHNTLSSFNFFSAIQFYWLGYCYFEFRPHTLFYSPALFSNRFIWQYCNLLIGLFFKCFHKNITHKHKQIHIQNLKAIQCNRRAYNANFFLFRGNYCGFNI